MKVKDFLAKKIKNLKINHIPVFQGGAIMHLIDSIGQLKGLKYYVPYHEQSLAMSVDAYSRIKGFGVGCVTSGPGGTNLITGVCCSYYDSIPCLFFTGQVGQFHIKKSKEMRQRGFQETDMVSLFSSITKFSYQIKSPNEVGYIFDKAVYIAKSGRPGPVIIDLPYNIQNANIDLNKLKKFVPPKNENLNSRIFTKIKKIKKLINKKQKVVFIAGGGLRVSNTEKDFLKIIKKLNIPFVTTWASQDITSYDNKLYFGSIGRHGHQSANEVINSADLLITFGFRFSPKAINENFKKNNNAKIISIDVDPRELNEAIIQPDIKICLDLKLFFNLFRKVSIKKLKNRKWVNLCSSFKKKKYINNLKVDNKLVNPYLFFNIFSKKIKKDSIVITDAGANLCWCMESFNITKNQRLISAWGNSPMGYSIGAGIGASYAAKNKQIFSLIGDGSFMMNVQEMQFLKHHNLNLKIIIFDNQGLGNTKLGTEAAFEGRCHANNSDYGYFPPNIRDIVKSYKLKYFFLDKNKDIAKLINNLTKYKGNAILHVRVSSKTNVIDHSDPRLNSIYSL
jgi:acetolactate synthase-1/2/3 large subunit